MGGRKEEKEKDLVLTGHKEDYIPSITKKGGECTAHIGKGRKKKTNTTSGLHALGGSGKK